MQRLNEMSDSQAHLYMVFMIDKDNKHFMADLVAHDDQHAFEEAEALYLEGEVCIAVLKGRRYIP